MKKQIFLCVFLIVNVGLFASQTTVVREFTYRANMHDSEVSAREKALERMKVEWLEEIGVLTSSHVHVSNRERDGSISESYLKEISQFTTGVIQAKAVDYKWDGATYWVKAELTANVEKIQQDMDNHRKQRQAEELKRIQDERRRAEIQTRQQVQHSRQQEKISRRQFRDSDKDNYLVWGGLCHGYPFFQAMSFEGRHGKIVGAGYYLEAGWLPRFEVTPAFYYSAGLKAFPYKTFFLSAGYGVLDKKTVTTFNDSKGRFGTDGSRLSEGFTFMAGYELLVNPRDAFSFFSFGAGASYDSFLGNWHPTISFKIGRWFKI